MALRYAIFSELVPFVRIILLHFLTIFLTSRNTEHLVMKSLKATIAKACLEHRKAHWRDHEYPPCVPAA